MIFLVSARIILPLTVLPYGTDGKTKKIPKVVHIYSICLYRMSASYEPISCFIIFLVFSYFYKNIVK